MNKINYEAAWKEFRKDWGDKIREFRNVMNNIEKKYTQKDEGYLNPTKPFDISMEEFKKLMGRESKMDVEKKYEEMWNKLDIFIMTASCPYSMANEMKNIKQKYFPKKNNPK